MSLSLLTPSDLAAHSADVSLFVRSSSWRDRFLRAAWAQSLPQYEIVARLDNTTFKTTRRLRECKNFEDYCDFLGVEYPGKEPIEFNRWQSAYFTRLKEAARYARKKDHEFLIQSELEDRIQSGWAVVFSTLTVSPQYYNQAMSGELSKDFSRAIDQFRNEVRRSIYGSLPAWRKAGRPQVSSAYIAKEYGEEKGRLHIHILWCFADLPELWKVDPAHGTRFSSERNMAGMCQLWPFGISQHIAVRFNPADYFGRLGWAWPGTPDGEPVPIGTPAAVGFYMTKYITKQAADSDEGVVFPWRNRPTKAYGQRRIRQIIQNALTNLSLPSKDRLSHLSKLLLKNSVTMSESDARDLGLRIMGLKKMRLLKYLILRSSSGLACLSTTFLKRLFMNQAMFPLLSKEQAMKMCTLTPPTKQSVSQCSSTIRAAKMFKSVSSTKLKSLQTAFDLKASKSLVDRLWRKLPNYAWIYDLLPECYQ